ncbi:MAG TPA: 16S rRNA (cytosine(1402)-N(4))-methyltransferase RsmH [Patescibacteria group bacterium]|nr:16S rRNA (cytosine(1402)-N(4))-methyltransferase RsmH [Patescibacteria group bacterium]
MIHTVHKPVMLEEALDYLQPTKNQNFVDCTFGGGGHALAILNQIKPKGKLIGIDWDPEVVESSSNDNLILVNDNYKNLKKIINVAGVNKIHGILLDLGLSSDQLNSEGRGFSFQDQGSLDLRYNSLSDGSTAKEILQKYGYQELVEIFKKYGEEPLAGPIAKKIIKNREQDQIIETADMLVQLVSSVYFRHFKSKSRRNPATRIFQALRIAVNDEFGNIMAVLPEAIEVLEPGGRLVVISFHSGEDRIVKHFFRQEAKADNSKIKLLTKKPIYPSEDEVKSNPRSHSAKMRVVEKKRL